MRRPYGAIPADEKTFIRRFRQARGWTLEVLGEMIGFTGQSVQRWETGDTITVENLYRLAEAFGCEPGDLLPGSVELSADEEHMLQEYRAASARDRLRILRIARDLNETDPPAYEVQKTGS